MLTQDVTKELEAAMEQLQQQGKEPTVALVKARLKTPVPMPALITAIKSWKSAQRVPKVEIAAQHHTIMIVLKPRTHRKNASHSY